jgi:putative phage-type endonuclease
MVTILKKGPFTKKEWLDLRRQGIGGSDAAAIAGVSRWKCPFQVYLEKLGDFEIPLENEPVYWGNVLEDTVAREFQKRSGKKVRRRKAIFRCDENPFMIANIDREVIGEKTGLECKTTSAWNGSHWTDESIPDEYMLQCQHYMKVMDWDYMYLAVFIGGQNFKWLRINRDDELISLLVSIEEDFWERVKRQDPPPLDGSQSATEVLKYLYPDAKNDEEIELEMEALPIIEKYKEACEAEKEAKRQKDEASNQLKFMLKDHQEASLCGYKVYWKPVTTRRFDTKRLKETNPEVYEAFLTDTTYRKFTIKEVV